MRIVFAVLSILALGACSPEPVEPTAGTARTMPGEHAGTDAGDGTATTPGDAAFAASETAMHAEMAEATGGTVDQAYIAKMMAHHRGAVAMADVALAQSQDPGILRMAQMVKDTQTAEIAEMQAWEPAPVVPAAAAPAPPATASAAAAQAAAPAEPTPAT